MYAVFYEIKLIWIMSCEQASLNYQCLLCKIERFVNLLREKKRVSRRKCVRKPFLLLCASQQISLFLCGYSWNCFHSFPFFNVSTDLKVFFCYRRHSLRDYAAYFVCLFKKLESICINKVLLHIYL